MNTKIIFILLLLFAGVLADNSTTTLLQCADAATPNQVKALSKIVDDIDRRTDAMESKMISKTLLNQTEYKLLNNLAKKDSFNKFKEEWVEFKQAQNWKWQTIKIELFALVLFGMFAMFIFQKFWEVGQSLIYWFIDNNKKVADEVRRLLGVDALNKELEKENKKLVRTNTRLGQLVEKYKPKKGKGILHWLFHGNLFGGEK